MEAIMFCCCFPSFTVESTPKLEMIHKNSDKWSQLTIKQNIKAVPYCENSSELRKVLELVDLYTKHVKENSNKPTVSIEENLRLLRNLKVVTDRRLEELPYVLTANNVNSLLINFSTMEDKELVIKELEITRTTLSAYERKKYELNKKMKPFIKKNLDAQNHLQILNNLYYKAQSALERVSEENNKERLPLQVEEEGQINSFESKLDLEELLNVLQETIGKMNETQLMEFIEKIRIGQTELQKEILVTGDELEWMIRCKGIMTKSVDLLHTLEEKLVQKAIEQNHLDYKDDMIVELETLDDKSELLHRHEIKGATNKTFVALTEQFI